ncbi:unnamed protein product [Prorocentrum cordatum]|uniref:Calmodulin n=1 Tax=Prorocentrum cordatum TaxID=2364126 RepID=A0ABN9UTT8_9DINO|nr:unnamed protein product [Polarella glacialis]
MSVASSRSAAATGLTTSASDVQTRKTQVSGSQETFERLMRLSEQSRTDTVVDGARSSQSSPAPTSQSKGPRRNTTKMKALRFPSTSPLTLEFLQWANSHWDLIEMLFKQGAGKPLRTLDEQEWCEGIRSCGFRGDARDAFRVIALDFGDESSEDSAHVTLEALRKFESPAARFIQLMREKHGTLLRAWRVELNKDGNAFLTYPEFAEACRNLGVASQGRSFWQSIHPTGQIKDTKLSPMTFKDFSTEEAQNLQDFADGLWETVAMDLDAAWRILDAKKIKFISADFINALPKLGYRGSKHNAKFLFRGLASGFGHSLGQARMGRPDLDVLLVLTDRGQCLDNLPPDMAELHIWVNRNLGGAANFLEAMELTDKETVQVYDLAKGIRLLGYPGNHTQTAAHVARFCRNQAGTQLRVEALLELLQTGRKPSSKRSGTPLNKRSGAAARPPRQISRGSRGDRWGRSAGPGSPGSRPVLLAWNTGGTNQADVNRKLPARCRKYFGDDPDKPVRDQIRKHVAAKLGSRAPSPVPSTVPSPAPSPRPRLSRVHTSEGPRAEMLQEEGLPREGEEEEEEGAAPDQQFDDELSDDRTETESTSQGDDVESTL